MFQKDQLLRDDVIYTIKDILSEQLINNKGVTFALDGEWGCGKTWIINELEHEYSQNLNYMIFHYNAWENDFYEEPLISILAVLIDNINAVYNQKQKYTKATKLILQNILTDLLDVASGIVKPLIDIDLGKITNRKINLFKKLKSEKKISNCIDKLLPLKNTVKTVRSSLSELANNFKIILFVDEVDRCLPEYSIKILERLHHICNNLPLITILALNESKLTDSINAVYGRYSSNQKEASNFANEYLKKIINFSIPLDNGQIDKKDLSIFMEFDQQFNPYKNGFGNTSFILNFYDTFLSCFEKRTQEQIISKAKLTHSVTISKGFKLENYSYFVMCIELFYFVIKELGIKYSQIAIKDNSQYKRCYLCTTQKLNNENESNFSYNLENFTNTEYTDFVQGIDTYIGYIFPKTDKQFFLNYFLDTPQNTELDEYIKYLLQDKEFLKHYKETMNAIYK